MSVRLPWVTGEKRCDPRPIWNVWDQVGLDTLTMVRHDGVERRLRVVT